MGKVKKIKAKGRDKRAAVRVATKARNNPERPGTRSGVETVAKGLGKRSGPRSGVEAAARGRSSAAAPAPKHRAVRVKQLVPQSICGPRTRVQQVFRVEERMNGSSQMHLVFNDHHGWYCEHGADCPAVGEVRKAR